MLILFLFAVIVSWATAYKPTGSSCMEPRKYQTFEYFDFWCFRMLKNLGRTEPENIIYGPYSVGMLLLQLSLINWEWHEQLTGVLTNKTNLDYNGLKSERDRLKKRNDNELNTSIFKSANMLFIGNSSLSDAFKKDCTPELCDFEMTTDEQTMFAWYPDHGSGRLKPGGLPSNSYRIAASNYVTFTSEWRCKFDVRQTEMRKFWVGNKSATIPFMHAYRYYMVGHLSGYNARVIALPFKRSKNGHSANMWIILPDNPSDFDLLSKEIIMIMANATRATPLKREKLHLYLPVFGHEVIFAVVNETLQAGVPKSILEAPCDRSDPGSPPGVALISQSSFIFIDETGSKHFNSSEIVMRYETDYMVESEVLKPAFNVNNPFFWIITSSTGSILLAGKEHTPMSME